MTVETATQSTVTSFEITYTGCEDVTVSTVSATAYARKGAVLEIAAINATADNGSYYQLKLTQDAGQTAEKVLNTFERQFVAGGDHGKTPDFNLPVEAEWTNVQISYLQGFMIKYGAKELGVVAKDSGSNPSTLVVNGKGLSDGKYVVVTEETATAAETGVATVTTDNTTKVATLSIPKASLTENNNGDVSIVPAVKVKINSALDNEVTVATADEEDITLSSGAELYVAEDTVLVFTEASLTAGKAVAVDIKEGKTTTREMLTAGVNADNKTTFTSEALATGAEYEFVLVNEKAISALTLTKVGNDLKTGADPAIGVAATDALLNGETAIESAYEVYYQKEGSLVTTQTWDDLGAGKDDVINVIIVVTGAEGEWFADEVTLTLPESDEFVGGTVESDGLTLTITFSMKLVDTTTN